METNLMIFGLAITYIGAYVWSNWEHRKRLDKINKLHLKEIKRAYEDVDSIMINALQITIDNCVLREDYINAAKAKQMLERYKTNSVK